MDVLDVNVNNRGYYMYISTCRPPKTKFCASGSRFLANVLHSLFDIGLMRIGSWTQISRFKTPGISSAFLN